MSFPDEELLASIEARSRSLDSLDAWPEASLAELAGAGCLRDAIPLEFGGSGRSAREIASWQLELASRCLVTAFVQSQRDAACHRIALCTSPTLKTNVFREIVEGRCFVTVGISHLSTSRQHGRTPAVEATFAETGYRLSGSIPWVTAARYAEEIVVGGTLPDGRQILGLLSQQSTGLRVTPSVALMALSSSQTASVEMHDVLLPHDRVLAGPVHHVMKHSSGGTGSLTTSTLALGHALGSLRRLKRQCEARADLASMFDAFQRDFDRQKEALLDATEKAVVGSSEMVREAANSLVLRITQAELAVTKGAGFVAGHPAERAVREAMFFLVWSCPQPVVNSALRTFAKLDDPEDCRFEI